MNSTADSGRMPVHKLVLPQPGKWSRKQRFFERKKMPVNNDFKDLFALFNKEKVEYLVVGAHAVIFYAEPRYTKDLDIWINPTKVNAIRVMKALEEFGAPLENVTVDDFTDSEKIFQIGVAPNRIDILMGIAGVDFATAIENKTISSYDDLPISILGKEELIISKKTIARPQDLLDIERLES
jgi:hypothetical protein